MKEHSCTGKLSLLFPSLCDNPTLSSGHDSGQHTKGEGAQAAFKVNFESLFLEEQRLTAASVLLSANWLP